MRAAALPLQRQTAVVLIAGLVLCALGALIHGYIFWLESIAWTGPRARRIFGLTEEETVTTRPLAFNQGFYNLFLAIAVIVGIVLVAAGARTAGAAAVLVGAGCMTAAGLVLLLSSPGRLRPALVQLVAPAAGVVLLTAGLLTA